MSYNQSTKTTRILRLFQSSQKAFNRGILKDKIAMQRKEKIAHKIKLLIASCVSVSLKKNI